MEGLFELADYGTFLMIYRRHSHFEGGRPKSYDAVRLEAWICPVFNPAAHHCDATDRSLFLASVCIVQTPRHPISLLPFHRLPLSAKPKTPSLSLSQPISTKKTTS